MTENKRFMLDDAGELIDKETAQFIEYGEKVCDLLNELHKENQSSKEFIEQLQEELVLFKNAGADMGIDLNNQITALKKENEQLKSYTGEMEDYLARLEEKNEQLKKELRNLRRLANEIYMEKTE